MVAALVRGARELSTAIADVAGKLDLRVALNSPQKNRHPWRSQLSRQMRDAGGAAGAGGGGGSRGGVQAGARAVAGSYGGGLYKVAGAVVVLVVVSVSGPAGAGW